MSRFFLSLRHSPLLAIHISEDLLDRLKPRMLEIFGVKLLKAEYVSDNGLYMYDFEATQDELSEAFELIRHVYESRIVKDIDIDINNN
jgi:hypothetical protein